MTKHTPGPWRVGLTILKGNVWKEWRETDIKGPEDCVLSLRQYHAAEEADANARLIAQAPAMYQWLKAFTVDYCPSVSDIAKYRAGARAILRAVDGDAD